MDVGARVNGDCDDRGTARSLSQDSATNLQSSSVAPMLVSCCQVSVPAVVFSSYCRQIDLSVQDLLSLVRGW